MFSILLRIFSLVFILWILRRFLATVLGHPKPERPGNDATKPAQKMVKDPVCGMYMDSRLAVRMEGREEVIYFCSEDCKKKYINGSSGTGTASDAAG